MTSKTENKILSPTSPLTSRWVLSVIRSHVTFLVSVSGTSTDFICMLTIKDLGTFDIDLTVSGTVPVAVAAGVSFDFVNATGAVRFSSSVISAIKSKYSGASSFTGSLTQFILSATNTAEGTINLAKTPIPVSTPVSLTGVASLGGGQLFVIPQDKTKTLAGTLTVKPTSKNGTLTS